MIPTGPRSAHFRSVAAAEIPTHTSAEVRRGLLFLRRPPAHDPRVEDIQRQAAAGEHLVVEAAEVERRAELLRRACTKVANLQLTEFVAARLSRPGDVAVGLRLDGRLI